jgi:hypothetical protein
MSSSGEAILQSWTLGKSMTAITRNDITGTNGTFQLIPGISPVIYWTNPAPILYPTALSSTQLNATANVPGSFAYVPPAGTVLNAGTNTLCVIFTPTDTVDYYSVTDCVSLVVLPTLTGTNIGIPGAPGKWGVTNSVYTVSGSGQGIFGTGDVFYFVYLPMQGDGMIVARLVGMQPDNAQSEAGVMMRDGLDSGSRHVFLGLDASTNMFLRRRLVADANSLQNAGPGTNVSWLRLTRMGNTFIGHVSTNGTNWNYAWATALVLPSQLDVGLAVTSHHYGYISTAEFTNLVIGPTTPLPGAWPGTAPRMYVCLDVGTQAAMQNLGGFPLLAGGVVGDQYSVKCSSNAAVSLASWQSLGTVTNTWGVATFLDSQALTNKMRFYRLQRVGP